MKIREEQLKLGKVILYLTIYNVLSFKFLSGKEGRTPINNKMP